MRWALVGASTIAAEHMIRAIRSVEDGEILHLVSSSPERGRSFAETHAIPAAQTDLAVALADPAVEAVYISTTNEKHFAEAMAALEAGKHVLCEKPLAMDLDGAIAMVKTAADKGLVFGTNHHLRCSGSHRAIREQVTSGAIGKVLSLRVHHAVHLPPHLQGWRINAPQAGGGVIPDITVHDADVVRFITDEDPSQVVAQMGASGMGNGVEDSAMSVWTLPSGAMVMSHESFTHPFAGSALEVHGTEGSIFAQGVMTQQPVGSIRLVTKAGTAEIGYSAHNLYGEAVSRFVGAVRGKGSPAATGEDGIKSLAVALAVRQAALTGQRQTVNYGSVA